MKKILFFFVAMCGMLYACTSADEPLVQPEQRPNLTVLEMYDIDEAVDIANEIAASLDISSSRVSTRKATLRGVHEYKTSKSRTEESPFYVVNYDDNQGYAIIAKKRITQPVMAVINDGSYEEGDIIDNPGFLMFMDAASSFVEIDSTIKPIDWEWKPGDGPIPAIQHKTVRDTLSSLEVSPKMQQYRWGQRFPEGKLCPNGISGCSNTAMFLVMAYFKSPVMMTYTYPGAEKGRETLLWSNILNHHQSFDVDISCCLGDIHTTISRICRQLGELNHSDYTDPTQTGSNRKYYNATLKKLLPNHKITTLATYNFTEVKSHLEKGIVFMRGLECETDIYNNVLKEIGGHAWIIDGCSYSYVRVKTYKKEYNDLSWVLESTTYETKKLLSVNWGWNGTHNGYFHAEVFNPHSTPEVYMRFFDMEYIAIEK